MSCVKFSREERVTLADSVETLDVDLRNETEKAGSHRKSKEENVQGEVRAGVMPTRTWGVHAVGRYLHREVKIKETNGGLCGQKRVRPPIPCSWKLLHWKWKKSSPPWPLITGQEEFGLENGGANKKRSGDS